MEKLSRKVKLRVTKKEASMMARIADLENDILKLREENNRLKDKCSKLSSTYEGKDALEAAIKKKYEKQIERLEGLVDERVLL